MEVQVLLFTEHQMRVMEMVADALIYLPREERRAVMEAALAEVNEE